MKKITLIAAAALAGISAFASVPQKVNSSANLVQTAQFNRHTAALRAPHPAAGITLADYKSNVATVLLQDDGTATSAEARYVPAVSAFYSGMGPASNYFKIPVAFTGIRNAIGFRNLTTGADKCLWTRGEVTGLNEDKTEYVFDYTSDETTAESPNYFMELNPLNRYTYPKLTATFGTDEVEYVACGNEYYTGCFYHTGMSPDAWGWNFLAQGVEEITSWDEVLGLSPCSAVASVTVFPEFSIVRPNNEAYNPEYNDANGTPLNWYAYSSETEKLENINIKAFATVIPGMPSPYQLDAMWFWYEAVASEDVPLTVNVYPVSSDGKVDFDNVIGTGEVAIPQGTNTLKSLGSMPVVILNAVDQDGYAIDSPICVAEGQTIVVAIEGVDNNALLGFDMTSYSSTVYSPDEEAIAEYLYPIHAYTLMNADVIKDGTTENSDFLLSAPYDYWTDKNQTQLVKTSDFNMFFDIEFPVVMNYDADSEYFETAYFNTVLSVEPEAAQVKVLSSYDLNQLYEEGIMTATTSADWISYEVSTHEAESEEDSDYTVVSVWANSDCPETETEGRTGKITFTGYACDFTVAVTQPAGGKGTPEGSISEIAGAAQGVAEYFDLQGRKLSAAPAKGVYIQRTGSTATKLVK